MIVLFMSSTMIVITAGFIKARRKKADMVMDVFNEVKLVMIMYHMILFTDFVPVIETQETIGISCIGFVIIGTTINMAFIFVTPIIQCKRKCRIKYHMKKAVKDRKRIDTKGFN